MDCGGVKAKLIDLVYGELSPAEDRALREHCRQCPGCGEELAALRGTLELTRGVPEPELPPFLNTRVIAHAREQAQMKKQPARRWAWIFRPQVTLAAVAMFAASVIIISMAQLGPDLRPRSTAPATEKELPATLKGLDAEVETANGSTGQAFQYSADAATPPADQPLFDRDTQYFLDESPARERRQEPPSGSAADEQPAPGQAYSNHWSQSMSGVGGQSTDALAGSASGPAASGGAVTQPIPARPAPSASAAPPPTSAAPPPAPPPPAPAPPNAPAPESRSGERAAQPAPAVSTPASPSPGGMLRRKGSIAIGGATLGTVVPESAPAPAPKPAPAAPAAAPAANEGVAKSTMKDEEFAEAAPAEAAAEAEAKPLPPTPAELVAAAAGLEKQGKYADALAVYQKALAGLGYAAGRDNQPACSPALRAALEGAGRCQTKLAKTADAAATAAAIKEICK